MLAAAIVLGVVALAPTRGAVELTSAGSASLGTGLHPDAITSGLQQVSIGEMDSKLDAETNARQAEATIEQVQTDLSKMATYAEEVQRSLKAEVDARTDVAHAIGYFRRQIELSATERDVSKAHLQRVESEVTSLQQKVRELEGQLSTCTADKKTLTEANKKVIKQLNSVFKFGQAVQTGLAVEGLDLGDTNSNTTS